jgi:hypothetical protein
MTVCPNILIVKLRKSTVAMQFLVCRQFGNRTATMREAELWRTEMLPLRIGNGAWNFPFWE